MPDQRDLPAGSSPHTVDDAEKAARKAERQARRRAEKLAAKADEPAPPAAPVTPADDSPAARRARNQAARAARRAERQAERAARRADRAGARSGDSAPAAPAAAPVADKAPATPAAARVQADSQTFNILAVAQGGRLECEAAILAASLRRNAPGWRGRLVVAEPQPTGAWDGQSPGLTDAGRATLTALGADIVPLHARHFGRSYPYGNKIEALALLPADEPFLFLDSDTLITGPIDRVPFDFDRPTASMRREGTWPEPPLYGPGYTDIWRSLYDRFGLDFASSLDLSQPDEHWERYLYFNAGWFCGADPAEFGRRFTDWAKAVRDDPGESLAAQTLDPWLDQAVLPLVIHSLGGGRPGADVAGMDGAVTWHYRKLPLLYATGPDTAVAAIEDLAGMAELSPLLDRWAPWARLVAGGEGRARVRPIFAGGPLPAREQAIRKRLKTDGLWID